MISHHNCYDFSLPTCEDFISVLLLQCGSLSSPLILCTSFYRGLVPHCLSVLKTCKYLTEQLVGMTMGNSQTIQTQELLTEVVTVAKRISPRVDEVVVAMYPPLDPRLLEARCVNFTPLTPTPTCSKYK